MHMKTITLNKNCLNKLLQIAIPIILSNLISQIQMLIDRIFLGRLDPLNMSALSNVSTPMWTSMSFCFSISIGASILISQNVGADNKEKTFEYSGALLKWCSILPLALFGFWAVMAKPVFTVMGVSENIMLLCMEYTRYFLPIFLILGFESALPVIMQTSNFTKPLIFFGIIRSSLNILLDYALIFGNFGLPALVIKGAAIATVIAEYAGVFIPLPFFFNQKNLPTLPHFKQILKAPFISYFHTVKLGINTALEDFTWNFGNLMMMRLLNTISEMAAGIYSIIFSVEILAVVIIGSIGNGTLTLTGEAKGKQNASEFKSVCRISYGLSATVSLITLILCIIFPHQVVSLFTKEASIIDQCRLFLILMSLNLFSKSGNIIIGSAIRGFGAPQWMFFTQIFGTIFVISLGCLFVLVLHLGISGVFFAVLLDEFVRFMINAVKLRSLARKI